MFRFIFFTLFAGGWSLSAACLYVVRTSSGVAILPKDSITFADTYADTRAWKMDDLPRHRALVQRLVETDREDLLAGISGAGGSGDELKKRLMDAAEKSVKAEKTEHSGSHLLDIAWGQ